MCGSRCMCPSRARVFGVPASPYRLRLRPCLGSGVVERVVCGAGLSLGCLTGLVRSAVGGPSQPRPARESRRGFAHRFDLSTLPRFTRLRRAPRLMHGETPFTAYQKRVGSQAGARGSSSLPRSGRTAVTGLSSPAAAARALRPLVLSAGSCAPGVSRLLPPPRRSGRGGEAARGRASRWHGPPARAWRLALCRVQSGPCATPAAARIAGQAAFIVKRS